jgi:hypothetical protein
MDDLKPPQPAAGAEVTVTSTNSATAPTPRSPNDGKQVEKNEEAAAAAEILKTLFGEVGDLIGDYTCAIESNILLHGRMYVTSKFICFYSNLFGLEKKIRIPYQHVKLLTKENTAVVIPNAIAINTHRKEYIFRSFWDRDECFNLISSIVSKYKENPSTRDSVGSIDTDGRPRSDTYDVTVGTRNSSLSVSSSDRREFRTKSVALTGSQSSLGTAAGDAELDSGEI